MSRLRTRVAVVAAASAASLALAGAPAFAADSVTQEIQAGVRTASVVDLALADLTYLHAAQNRTGSMLLNVDDSSGSNAGWNVTVVTSDFLWSAGTGGASSGSTIPAANFALTSAAAPLHVAGQAIDVVDGPLVPVASPIGTLDTPRKTIQANAAFGNGTYTQLLDVDLTVPALSAAGTYTGTLTTTISAAP